MHLHFPEFGVYGVVVVLGLLRASIKKSRVAVQQSYGVAPAHDDVLPRNSIRATFQHLKDRQCVPQCVEGEEKTRHIGDFREGDVKTVNCFTK